MTVKQLLYYVTIADTGSFTVAAEKLNLSQPPLSKQMMLLEKELDVQLLIRSSRKIRLTEAGVVMYNRAKDILKMMDNAVAEVNHISSGICGTLRLGVVSSASASLLDHRMQKFHETYPNIMFEIYEDNTHELLEQLKSGKLDAVVVRTPFNSEGFISHKLNNDPLVAACKASFIDDTPEGSILPVRYLLGLPLIYSRSYESLIANEFEQVGIPKNVFCKNRDTKTSVLMANAGLGVAILPESVARQMVRGEDMVIRKIDMPNAVTQVAYVYKKEGYIAKGVKEFAEFFQ